MYTGAKSSISQYLQPIFSTQKLSRFQAAPDDVASSSLVTAMYPPMKYSPPIKVCNYETMKISSFFSFLSLVEKNK